MTKRLDGRRVILTGAGSGIGLALVRRFMSEGARLTCLLRHEEEQAALPEVGDLHCVVGDATDMRVNAALVETAVARFGGVDVVIANAGVWDFFETLDSMNATQLEHAADELLAINTLAPLYLAHAAADALRASGGVMLVTGSNAAFRSGGGGVLYTMSKFALRGMVQQLSREWAPSVRVIGIAPGATNTGLRGTKALDQRGRIMNARQSSVDDMARHIPLRRVSQPEDHAGLYVMLAAEAEAPYITGSMILSDGGLVAAG